MTPSIAWTHLSNTVHPISNHSHTNHCALNVIHSVTPSLNPSILVLVPLTLALNMPQKPRYVYPSMAFASVWINCLGTPLVPPFKLYSSSLTLPKLNCIMFSVKRSSGKSESSAASWYQKTARRDAAYQDGANVWKGHVQCTAFLVREAKSQAIDFAFLHKKVLVHSDLLGRHTLNTW